MLSANRIVVKGDKISCMPNPGDLLKAWREQRNLNRQQVATRVGTSRQQITAIELGTVKTSKFFPAIARLLGFKSTDEYLAARALPEAVGQHGPPHQNKLGPAVDGSAANFYLEEVHQLIWEQLQMDRPIKSALPALFQLQLPDDAMAPRARTGARVTFRRDEQPRAGDGVLVRDKHGALYFRYYRPRRVDHWEAHAENREVLPLDSAADGLEVLGVLVGLEARWG